MKQQFVVTHTNRQIGIARQVVTNMPSVKMLHPPPNPPNPPKKLLLVTFSQEHDTAYVLVYYRSVKFSVSCKNVYRWDMSSCFMVMK